MPGMWLTGKCGRPKWRMFSPWVSEVRTLVRRGEWLAGRSVREARRRTVWALNYVLR